MTKLNKGDVMIKYKVNYWRICTMWDVYNEYMEGGFIRKIDAINRVINLRASGYRDVVVGEYETVR